MVRGTSFWAALAASALLFAACAPSTGSQGSKPTVRVGSTNFGEQVILAEIYSQVLEANGYPVERRFNLGAREIVAPALESGQIDMYPEYLATYTSFVTKDPTRASADPVATQRNAQEALKPKGISVLDYAPAVNVNGYVVTKATADRLGLSKISDLSKANGQLTLGGPPECPDRPFCLKGLQDTYGLRFKDFKPLDVGGPLTVAALEGNQIDVGVLFTTDAVIQTKNFVLLQDDKKLQLADNVVPVVRDDLLSKAPSDFGTLINSVTTKITTEELTSLNRQADVERKERKDVAAAWLKSKGLLR